MYGKFSITAQQVVYALSAVITQAVAFGILNDGIAQKVVAVGGIIIPAAFSIATALHLGRVHAAQVGAASAVVHAPAGTYVPPAAPVVPPVTAPGKVGA